MMTQLSPAHAGRTPAAKLLRWNHSIVSPPRRRIRRTFSSLPRSTGSGGDSPLPTVPDSRAVVVIHLSTTCVTLPVLGLNVASPA